MSESILQLKDVAVFQGENLVLNDISLEIKKGEFVYLIGKTGSGKSSFMKTLYGDLPLKQGSGYIVDFNLTTLKEKDIPYFRILNYYQIATSTITFFLYLKLPAGRTRAK